MTIKPNLQKLTDYLGCSAEDAQAFLAQTNAYVHPAIDASLALWALKQMNAATHTPLSLAKYLCVVKKKHFQMRINRDVKKSSSQNNLSKQSQPGKVAASPSSSTKTHNKKEDHRPDIGTGDPLVRFYASLSSEDKKLVEQIKRRLEVTKTGGFRDAVILMGDLQNLHSNLLRDQYARRFIPWAVKIMAQENNLNTRSIVELVWRATGNDRETYYGHSFSYTYDPDRW